MLDIGDDPLVHQRALYYPMLPPQWWVRRALLLHDSFTLISGALSTAGVNLRFVAPTGEGEMWEWLSSEGHVVEWAGGGVSDHEAYAREVASLLRSEVAAPISSEFPIIIDGGAGSTIDEKSLAIAARYVTETNVAGSMRVIPETDRTSAFNYACNPEPDRTTRRCHQLLLEGVIPTPGEGTAYQDIVDFRSRYRDELTELRVTVDRLLAQVRGSQNPEDSLNSTRQELEHAIRTVAGAARARRLRLASAATLALAIGTTVSATLPPGTTQWVFDGFGGAAVASLSTRIASGRATSGGYSYLVRAARRFSP